jgi:hypothetical protein
MEAPPWFDSSKLNLGSIGKVFGVMTVFGLTLAAIIPYFQCSSSPNLFEHSGTVAYYGFVWGLFPTIVYLLLQVSPRLSEHEFAKGAQTLLGWTGSSDFVTLGTTLALFLMTLVMTTYILHRVEANICQPTVDELASFQENLMKSLKKKETTS